MNTPILESVAAESAPAALPANAALAHTLVTLIRREFWEHRSLWVAPLLTAALLALCAIPGVARFDLGMVHMHTNAPAGLFTEEQRLGMSTIVQWALWGPLYLVMLFVLGFYLIDCLYAERRDRSILFWKSLPVSDALTVLSKLLVALAVVPLMVFALALLTYVVFAGIWQANVALGRAPAILAFDPLVWLKVEIAMLLGFILSALWYAPIAAYFMLVSAWARGKPLLWALLPLVLTLIERIAFGTHYLYNFIAYRLGGIWRTLSQGYVQHSGGLATLRPYTLLGELNFGAAFLDIDLWLGVLAAALMLYAAVRIRRYRDDS